MSSYIDYERSTCLCDVGAPDYLAAIAVADDGTYHLVLVLYDGIDDDDVRYDARCRGVGHEKLGRLPRCVRERIGGNDLRCGRPTAAGRPCRHAVNEPGEACCFHRGRS